MKASSEAKDESLAKYVKEPLQSGVPVLDGDAGTPEAVRDDSHGSMEIDCPSPSIATLISLVMRGRLRVWICTLNPEPYKP